MKNLFEIYSEDPRDCVPLGICVDDIVFAAGLTCDQRLIGQAGLIEQFASVMSCISVCMKHAGSDLDHVARVTAYVDISMAADRRALYPSWESIFFPVREDRPAFKVLVAPLPPGCLIRVDLIGVLSGRRQRYDIDGVPAEDPTIKIGDWVFTSRVHGTVPYSNVQEDPDQEASQTFDNLEALIQLSGIPQLRVAQVTTFASDKDYLPRAREILADRLTNGQSRTALISPIPSHLGFMAEMVANRGIHFQELYLRPESDAAPSGLRLGSLVILPKVNGASPSTGDIVEGGTEHQLRQALRNVADLMKYSGCSMQGLARLTFFMRDLRERPILNKVMADTFPDPAQRPPHKYIRADLPSAQHIAIQALAIHGESLRALSIPGLQHQDPMSMGARIGSLVVSSRLFGIQPFTGKQGEDDAEHLALDFEHADALLADAQLCRRDITQITAFLKDAGSNEATEAAFKRYGATQARLNILETDLGGMPFPRLEIIALART